jgi:predicted nucleic acid-binding protein
MIQLDTSFLIRALIPGTTEDGLLRRWVSGGRALAVSAVVWTEFLCGPLRPREIQLAAQVVGPVLPFGGDEATVASDLFNQSGRRRGSLVDCMVAASAICHGAALATANPDDFRRFAARGLEVVSA